MRLVLLQSSLRHRRLRVALAVLGVAVAAALLLDMVMLATGMRSSFRSLLLVRGYQLRITPKGTLPFDTDATIAHADAVLRRLRANPDLSAVSPVLGAQLHVLRSGGEGAGSVGTSFALGIDPSVAGDYQLEEGAEPAPPDRMIVNTIFERQLHVRVGDTLDAAVGFDPQLRTFAGRRRLVVVGEGQFYYTPLDAAVAALPLATLQAMGGPERTDRVSLFMARVRHGVDPDRVAGTIARTIPGVSVLSTAAALDQLDERMSYFRQLALVLGATSSIVGFLLVTTLVTVSVQERAGEIVVLRAIGVSRPRVVGAIVLESLGLTTAGAVLGVGLGLVTARYFNSILSAFPNLPAGFRFFVFHPTAAWLTGALLIASGLLASVYPSWRAASLPIAATLRREATA